MKKVILLLCLCLSVSTLSNAWPNWSWLRSTPTQSAPIVSSIASKVRSLKLGSFARSCQRTLMRYKKPIVYAAAYTALTTAVFGAWYMLSNVRIVGTAFSWFAPSFLTSLWSGSASAQDGNGQEREPAASGVGAEVQTDAPGDAPDDEGYEGGDESSDEESDGTGWVTAPEEQAE